MLYQDATEVNMAITKCAVYARVSTSNGQQSPDMQLAALREYCTARGFSIYKEYVDEGVSGSKDSRPSLNAMMDAARKRKFDVVCVWKFDRFARSTKHLLAALEEFRSLGINFISYSENLDTSTPLGKAVFTIVAAIGELERSLIVERVRAGLQAARGRGKRLGRPTAQFDIEKALQLKARGLTMREIAADLGISKSTIARLLSQKPQENAA
jgi:DNA invertase Pin-like site-specific DNA recombinase